MNEANINRVFSDELLQGKFDRRGYVILPNLLTKEDIQKLKELFARYAKQIQGSFHTTHFSDSIEYKQVVHDTITSVVYPRAAALLNDFYPLFGNFMIKNPDPNTAMDLHADWTYVDETKFASAAIWLSLVDTNEENGCFGLIEGSHRITNLIRGPMIRQTTRQHEKSWEKKYGKLIPVRAGDAIIYNHRLLHYSPPNRTASARPALNLSLTPKNTSWIHYCIPEGKDSIHVYQVPDSNFYIRYKNFQVPETNTLVNTLPIDTVKYIDSKMERFWQYKILNFLTARR